jgi:hypothetical protein
MGPVASGEGKAEEAKISDQKTEEPKLSAAFKAIQIALDDYGDIFSDFDTSPYSRRTISDDFLKEIEKRYVENKKGEFEVRLTIQKHLRDPKIENTIKKRLRDYFLLKLAENEGHINNRKKIGAAKILVGAAVLIMIFELALDPITSIASLFTVFAWYSLWSGFESILDLPFKLEEERQLYKKFSLAKYYFISEEDINVEHQFAF